MLRWWLVGMVLVCSNTALADPARFDPVRFYVDGTVWYGGERRYEPGNPTLAIPETIRTTATWNARVALGARFRSSSRIGGRLGVVGMLIGHNGLHPAIGVEAGLDALVGDWSIGPNVSTAYTFGSYATAGVRARTGMLQLGIDLIAYRQSMQRHGYDRLDPGILLGIGVTTLPTRRQVKIGAGVTAAGALLTLGGLVVFAVLFSGST